MSLLTEYICSRKINTEPQIAGESVRRLVLLKADYCFLQRGDSAAFEYLKTHPVDPVNKTELEQACGVGVVVTREKIEQEVASVVAENRSELVEKRYRFNFGKLMGTR